MQENKKEFMDTKFVGHHVSAGGYIFCGKEQDISVVLLRNKKGEWWIPKGHVESWENELEACYREIEEEVGIKKEELHNAQFLENYKFSFLDENQRENTKEIFIYVFKTLEKVELNFENGGDDVKMAKWMSLEEALENIMSYSKPQLEKAINMYKEKNN